MSKQFRTALALAAVSALTFLVLSRHRPGPAGQPASSFTRPIASPIPAAEPKPAAAAKKKLKVKAVAASHPPSDPHAARGAALRDHGEAFGGTAPAQRREP